MMFRSQANGKTIEGRELSKTLEQTIEFKNYSERFARRLGNDEKLLNTLLEAFGGEDGVLRKARRQAAKDFRTGR